jgi:hypothetical protein
MKFVIDGVPTRDILEPLDVKSMTVLMTRAAEPFKSWQNSNHYQNGHQG